MENKLSQEDCEYVFLKAQDNLSSLATQYEDAPEGEKSHLYRTILPRIAMYRALREKLSLEDSVSLIDETVKINCLEVGKKLHKFTSFPLMKGLFMRLFGKMITDMFGEKAGFRQKLYEKNGKSLVLDILDCPYWRTSNELDASEIAHSFCDSDTYCYGNLSGIEFKRSQTLAKGGDKCDFCFKRVK